VLLSGAVRSAGVQPSESRSSAEEEEDKEDEEDDGSDDEEDSDDEEQEQEEEEEEGEAEVEQEEEEEEATEAALLAVVAERVVADLEAAVLSDESNKCWTFNMLHLKCNICFGCFRGPFKMLTYVTVE
jgi:hypothetical protein